MLNGECAGNRWAGLMWDGLLMWDGFSTRPPPEGRLLRSRGRVENPSHISPPILRRNKNAISPVKRTTATAIFSGYGILLDENCENEPSTTPASTRVSI